ncbi:hypothetical protein WJX82_011238 [Trebouxia sp. C0006]
MQAVARLRLLRDLVRADVLPAAALHTVESAALRIVSGNGTRCQSFRVNSARYVASCPAVDQPAWLHTDPGHWAPYTARPVLDNREESFLAYLALPTKKSSHLTHIVKKSWSCASLYQRNDPTHYHAVLQQLEEQALQWRNDEIRLQHAVTVLWSMARSHFLPSTNLLEKVTEIACLQIRGAVPHAAPDIEMLFLGYAWLGYPPPPQAMQAIVDCFLGQRLQGHQASNMAWALAVLGQLNMATFTSLLAHVRPPHLQDIKICRQLHFALEFLRPNTAVGPEYQQWQRVSEHLHVSWPRCREIKKTRLLHQQVLEVLRDGLQLKCFKDTTIQREHGHDLFSIDILIEEQPGVPHDIAVEVDGPDSYIHNEPDKHRLLGPAAFRNLMLLRQVPRLITIPYYEWVDKGVHVAHTYLQDKLRTEGQCDLPDFVLPE